eukprot:scaffold27785_cov81-Phaeocystis_antarctica.AAC.8
MALGRAHHARARALPTCVGGLARHGHGLAEHLGLQLGLLGLDARGEGTALVRLQLVTRLQDGILRLNLELPQRVGQVLGLLGHLGLLYRVHARLGRSSKPLLLLLGKRGRG